MDQNPSSNKIKLIPTDTAAAHAAKALETYLRNAAGRLGEFPHEASMTETPHDDGSTTLTYSLTFPPLK